MTPRSVDKDDRNLAEEMDAVWDKLTLRCAQLSVHTGLVCSIAPRYPQYVQEGLIERMESQIAWVDQQIHEIHEFGASHDEE